MLEVHLEVLEEYFKVIWEMTFTNEADYYMDLPYER